MRHEELPVTDRPLRLVEPAMDPDALPVEPLLSARDVARMLGVRVTRVYELPIPRVQLSQRSFRWLPSDVRAFLADRRSLPGQLPRPTPKPRKRKQEVA